MIDIVKIMENMIVLAEADLEAKAITKGNTICGMCLLEDELACGECILGLESDQLKEVKTYIDQLKLLETLDE